MVRNQFWLVVKSFRIPAPQKSRAFSLEYYVKTNMAAVVNNTYSVA